MTSLDHDAWPDARGSFTTLVGRLQERLETLSSALDEVRATVQLLAGEARSLDASPKPVLRVVDAQEPSEVSSEALIESSSEEPVETATVASLPARRDEAEAAWFHREAEAEATIAETPAPAVERPATSEAVWSTPDASAVDDEAAREEVRRAVASARADLAANNWPETPMPAAPSQSTADQANEAAANSRLSARDAAAAASLAAERDEVQRAVDQMRAELAAAGELEEEEIAPAGADASDPAEVDAVRDEVRRAVEQARAELAAGTLRVDSEVAGAGEAKPMWAATTPAPKDAPPSQHAGRGDMEQTLAALQASRDEMHVGALSIVIEDSEGRVDLARVYDTLSRVKSADQAVLLNYTPHSVTVGVGQRALPDANALEAAATAVFGRPCSVSADGGKMVVRILSRPGRVAPTR